MRKFSLNIQTMTARTCAFFASVQVSETEAPQTSKEQPSASPADLAKFQNDFDIITANGGPTDISTLHVA